jgi:hypothetical protein
MQFPGTSEILIVAIEKESKMHLSAARQGRQETQKK